MQSDLPWNVPGIPADAREAARAAARREGLSLGEWLTRRIETDTPEEGGADAPANDASADEPRPLTAYPASGAALDKALADAGLDLGEFAHGLTEGPADQETAGICLQIEEQLQMLSDTLTSSGVVNETRMQNPGAALADGSADNAAQARLEEQIVQLCDRLDTLAARPPQYSQDQIEELASHMAAHLAARIPPSAGLTDPTLPDTLKTLQRSLAGLDEHMGAATGRTGTRLAELAKDLLVLTGKVDRLHADFAAQGAVSTCPSPMQGEADSFSVPMHEDTEEAPRPHWRKYALATMATIVVLVGGLGIVGWIAMPQGWRDMALAPLHMSPARQNTAVPVDPVAHDLATKARSGNAKAALSLGLRYADSGDPAQMAEAVKWLQLAAQEGEPSAQYRLADLYAHGAGVTADPVKAANLFLAAASDSNRQAMYQLASAYATGTGVKQDDAAAAHWFQLAANAGSTDAAFNLAVLYERGGGITQNLKEAYKWYAIAAAQGDSEGKARLPVLAGQLTEAARHSAEDAAAAFHPSSLNNLPIPGKK